MEPEKTQNAPESQAINPALLQGADPLATEPAVKAGKPFVPQVPLSDKPIELPTEKTWGERRFDQLIYWGNGFVANLLLSAGITLGVNHTRTGRTFYKALDSLYRKAGVQDGYIRAQMSNAFTLLTGGHITAAIVKVSEDRKGSIVRWLDTKHYGKDAEQNPEIAAAHARIDAESKPTWLNILLSRIICWATIQTTAFTIGKTDNPLTLGDEGNLVMKFARERNIPVLKNTSILGPSEAVARALVRPSKENFKLIFRPQESVLNGAKETARRMEKAVEAEQKYDEYRVARGKSRRTSEQHKADAYIAPKSFREGLEMFTTYSVMDTLYTLITAWMLKPVLRELGRELPGMRTNPQQPIDSRLQGRFALPEVVTDDTRDPAPEPVPALAEKATQRPKPTVHAIERAGYAEAAMAAPKIN